MKEIIVIGSSPGREEWVMNCAKTLNRPYIVVSNYGYELGKIKWVFDNTKLDRFVFLQDSVEITDTSIFDRIWNTKGSICLHHDDAHHYSCYLGVYEKRILAKLDIPVISTKQQAIDQELGFPLSYQAIVGDVTCFDTNGSFGNIVEKFGRDNYIYSNDFMIKYRGDFGQGIHRGQDPEDAKLK
jgi:hypothetical protein